MFRPGSKRLLALNCPKLRRTGRKTSCLWNSRGEWRTLNLPHFGNRDTLSAATKVNPERAYFETTIVPLLHPPLIR